ncbi:adenosine deaminase [Arcobacter sp. CECT 8985]|uniref:adenosine deaminase n=1 Tax=Arcobacter sp. CECT 8985 TaxID=1935424 RepID=UPI00100BF3B8|nr:adenosine deaminase [Arcobacter sp. CECT 8985]RXJ87129.1 adenosine deaminase [Arcobacter sp. CECT 8985]
MKNFINDIPKAELHLHIEGTLEPELMFKLATKNNIKLNYKTIEDIKKAYNFTNLQSFLDIYYSGAKVLINEEDFYDLTFDYLKKCKQNNIIHTEIFFDPQTHTARGIKFETVINGISKALEDAKNEFSISSKLIMCFLRHLSEEEAFDTLKEAIKFKDKIIGIGLDSSEIGNPPSKFKNVFSKAKNLGFKLVAHAGEEAGFEYINDALDLLNVDRIDHGVQAINNNKLMQRLKDNQIALTVCPLSNTKLKVFEDMKEHNIKQMLEYGLNVTVNSDDPSYFGGYLNDNFHAISNNLNLSKENIIKLVKNSFNSSFISNEQKAKFINIVDEFIKNN